MNLCWHPQIQCSLCSFSVSQLPSTSVFHCDCFSFSCCLLLHLYCSLWSPCKLDGYRAPVSDSPEKICSQSSPNWKMIIFFLNVHYNIPKSTKILLLCNFTNYQWCSSFAGVGVQRHTLLTLACSSGLEISAHDSDVWVNWCDCWLARQHRGKMTGTWILAGHQCLISSPKSLEMHVIWKKSTMLWTVLNTRSRQRPFSINPS